MKIKNLKVNRLLVKSLVGVGVCLVIASPCVLAEVTMSQVEQEPTIYELIDGKGENVEIAPQELDVPEEDFKLIVEYSLDDNAKEQWRISENKMVTTKIYTKGLPEGVKVYVDNIHTDTTIVSTDKYTNGIVQDSMNARIQNTGMYGYPISDTMYLISDNYIQGQSKSFSSEFAQGLSSRNLIFQEPEEKFSEAKFLESGVIGNDIVSTYKLLIQKGDNEPYGVDVSSNVMVYASLKKTEIRGNKEFTYRFIGPDNNQEWEFIEKKEKPKVKKLNN